MEKPVEIFLSQVKISGDSDFIRKFNNLSDLFAKFHELPEGEAKDHAFNEWYDAKWRLETGG